MDKTTTNPSTTDWEPDWDRQFFYGSTAIPGPGGRSAKDHITMDVIGNEAMKRHIRTLLSRKEEEAYRKGREDESDESLLEHKRELKEKEKEVRKEVVEFIRAAKQPYMVPATLERLVNDLEAATHTKQ